MKRLARHRDFRLLFAGHVTSLFGDRALFVVLGIWALELTGSTGAGGIAFGFQAVAGFLAPLAGVIADRFPRRHVLIGKRARDRCPGARPAVRALQHLPHARTRFARQRASAHAGARGHHAAAAVASGP
jgi:hypothetical protein